MSAIRRTLGRGYGARDATYGGARHGAASLVTAACSSGSSGDAAVPAATTTATIRVVNQNLLHGTACPADSNRCDLPGRGRPVPPPTHAREVPRDRRDRRGQPRDRRPSCARASARATTTSSTTTTRARTARSCSPPLRVGASERLPPRRAAAHRVLGVARVRRGPGRPRRHPPREQQRRPPVRRAGRARRPCATTDTLNTCQARQTVDDSSARIRGPDAVTLLAGDLNAKPDEPTIAALTARGLVDTHLAVGNPECDPDDRRAVHQWARSTTRSST